MALYLRYSPDIDNSIANIKVCIRLIIMSYICIPLSICSFSQQSGCAVILKSCYKSARRDPLLFPALEYCAIIEIDACRGKNVKESGK